MVDAPDVDPPDEVRLELEMSDSDVPREDVDVADRWENETLDGRRMKYFRLGLLD